MKLKLALASALTLASMAAMADDQTVTFAALSTLANFSSVGTTLAGGNDEITFDGLAPGAYSFTIGVLSTNGAAFTAASNLNGIAGTPSSLFGVINFLGVVGANSVPLVLTLVGSTAQASASYTGTISVTAVPEPGTYAMLLAGLAAVGFVAKRRSAGV